MAGTTEKQLYGAKVTYPSPKPSQLEMELKAEVPYSLKLHDPLCAMPLKQGKAFFFSN